nr:aprataxin and PNK-like factor [Cherax quadricarinatus]
MFAELKYILEKWRKGEFDIGRIDIKQEVKEKYKREISTEVPVGEIVKMVPPTDTMEDVNIDTIRSCEHGGIVQKMEKQFEFTTYKFSNTIQAKPNSACPHLSLTHVEVVRPKYNFENIPVQWIVPKCTRMAVYSTLAAIKLVGIWRTKCDSFLQSQGDALKTVSGEIHKEVQSAVSTRKRNLPSWLAKNEVTKDGGKQIGKDTLHSHGVSQNTHSSAAKRKRAGNSVNKDSIAVLQASTNTTVRDRLSTSPAVTALPAVQNDDVASNSKLNKQKNSTTPTKNKQDLSTKKAIASPIKVSSPKNRLGKVHNMSEEDSDGEATNEENQTRDQSTCNTKRHDYAKQESPPDRRHSPSKHRNISESEDDDELNGTINDTNNVSSNAPVSSTATGTSPAVTQKKVPRKTCQYGRNCYRKNPQHREDFAHDGDSDFNDNPSNNEDSDDDRPECEYGVKCYRKNTDHRRNFKHSRMPQPQRKAKRKARRQKQDEESASDDYDYDDPFLNDDSSDEYAPTESDTE